MPRGNQFRHQAYHSERPTSPYHLLREVRPTEPSSAEFRDSLAASGAAFGRAGVGAIYCVHGTFAGNDALGLLTELARFFPELSNALRKIGKQSVDFVAGETGNYTRQYVAAMEEGLSAGAGRNIPVRLFNWSSQNNHIGRADGAVRLIDELARCAEGTADASDTRRILVWGHSHGGNVFSLLTNILGADRQSRDEFFHVARSFYRPWVRRHVDLPVWPRVQAMLAEPDHPLRRAALDVVTFGTPVRYGWDADGYGQLLHFIHHRPPEQGPEYLAPRPIQAGRLHSAADGDFVQQIGIAGTNLAANPFALRTFVADWRLDKFLERDVPRERIVARLAHGTRVPDEGSTLLVDYQGIASGLHQHLAGHAVYTRRKWLPFHCHEVATRFYGEESSEAAAADSRGCKPMDN